MFAITLTIRPRFAAIIAWFATSRQTWNVPTRLFFTTARKPLGEMCCAGDGNWPPALLTRMSIRPSSPSTAVTNASTCAGSRVSPARAKTVPPAGRRAPAPARGAARVPRRGVELVLGPAGDRDARAEPRLLARGGQTVAATAAGDDGDLIAKD